MNLIKQIEYNYITGLIFLILGIFVLDFAIGLFASIWSIFGIIVGFNVVMTMKNDIKIIEQND